MALYFLSRDIKGATATVLAADSGAPESGNLRICKQCHEAALLQENLARIGLCATEPDGQCPFLIQYDCEKAIPRCPHCLKNDIRCTMERRKDGKFEFHMVRTARHGSTSSKETSPEKPTKASVIQRPRRGRSTSISNAECAGLQVKNGGIHAVRGETSIWNGITLLPREKKPSVSSAKLVPREERNLWKRSSTFDDEDSMSPFANAADSEMNGEHVLQLPAAGEMRNPTPDSAVTAIRLDDNNTTATSKGNDTDAESVTGTYPMTPVPTLTTGRKAIPMIDLNNALFPSVSFTPATPGTELPPSTEGGKDKPLRLPQHNRQHSSPDRIDSPGSGAASPVHIGNNNNSNTSLATDEHSASPTTSHNPMFPSRSISPSAQHARNTPSTSTTNTAYSRTSAFSNSSDSTADTALYTGGGIGGDGEKVAEYDDIAAQIAAAKERRTSAMSGVSGSSGKSGKGEKASSSKKGWRKWLAALET